jgi:SAM-dependent methyltransferase
MTYKHFAFLYDELMKDVPYDAWLAFVKRKLAKYGNSSVHSFIDLGCGTGALSIRLAKEGFSVIGVDLSEHMLAIANQKAIAENCRIEYYQQSMAELSGFTDIDCVVCFCDSLNYLQTEDEVKQTFKQTFTSLKKDGLFIFDVHSIYKISQIFMNQSFVCNDEEVSYIWNCFPGDVPNSIKHDLSFFAKVLDHDNLYERFDEYHLQRTFPVIQYQEMLEEAGFTILEVSGDFEDISLSDNCERVFFTVRK